MSLNPKMNIINASGAPPPIDTTDTSIPNDEGAMGLLSPSAANGSAEESVPSSVFDYIVCTEFDKAIGLNVTKQFPLNLPLISNQLDNVMGLIMPPNLQKFLNREHYTMVPLYIDLATGLLSYSKDTLTFVPCYLYSLSYFQTDNTFRNGTARAISIVTRLPIIQVFKPLMYFMLQNEFQESVDASQIETVWQNMNQIPIPAVVEAYKRLSYDERFVLTRLDQGKPVLSSELRELFPHSDGSLIKCTVNLGKIDFPIQIPETSLLCSHLSMYGSDLQKDCNLHNLLEALQSCEIEYDGGYQECPMAPYPGIDPLCLILNAVLLRKKIVLYCYDSCYNIVMDFGSSLLCLFNDELHYNYPFYPILDLGTLDLIKEYKSYLIGTSNLLFKEKLSWDVYFDMDLKKIYVRPGDESVWPEFFLESSSTSDDKRISVLSSGIRSLFKHGDSVVSDVQQSVTTFSSSASLLSDTSSIISMCSPESTAASKLSSWDPLYFPHIKKERIDKFLDSQRDTNFFQFGFHFQRIPFEKTIFASGRTTSSPSIDTNLLNQVKLLLHEHHTDLTIYIVLTNYLRDLTCNILPSFYHYLNWFKLREYRKFIQKKLSDDNSAKNSNSNTSTPLELRNYIKNEKIILPLPLNYMYSPETTFVDSSKQHHYYSKMVYQNRQLLKLAAIYDDTIFTVGSNEKDLIPGFLFDWQGEVLRYDICYTLSIFDRLIDGKSSESWRLNMSFVLQFYKSMNQILKTDKAHIIRLLADYFTISELPLEFKPEEDDSINPMQNDDILAQCYEKGFTRFNKLVVVAASYQVAKGSVKVKTKKDLVLAEFKKVLSSILNNTFFKKHMLHHLDDYMKLNINDFIDYHM